ncbi:substrate-binding domain-containing protein [Nonomuraea sp. NPDC049400]|uniref:substrate-binding domain-containing protein n=1 Tax=Nonomuraea sp. NPDC049400 TaxID=3364352 RepID=UPI0037A12D78
MRRAEERGMNAVFRPCEGTFESTAGTLARILGERPGTTGFVVLNQSAIPHVLSLLPQLGRVVTEDASVVAICPDRTAVQTSPQVTNVAVPAAQLGSRAAELVVAQLAGETVEGVTLIAPRLTVRGSSAPMRAPSA